MAQAAEHPRPMKNTSGEMKNYREFCEAITSRSDGAWFMTLTDVFFKLYYRGKDDAQAFLDSLDELSTFLNRSLRAKD